MSTFDYNNLPPEHELEAIVNQMDRDECLEMMTQGRQLMLANANKEDRDEELERSQARASMFVAMRFRVLREVKNPKNKKAAAPSLGDLLNGLGA